MGHLIKNYLLNCTQVAIEEIRKFSDYVRATAQKINGDNQTKAAMGVCVAVIDNAASQLNDSVSLMDVSSRESLLSAGKIDDMRTWLNSAITNLDTCLVTLEVWVLISRLKVSRNSSVGLSFHDLMMHTYFRKYTRHCWTTSRLGSRSQPSSRATAWPSSGSS